MTNEEISFKDLSRDELDDLKDIYVLSRINKMVESELRLFVKEVLEVQIKGTVGNQEEKEAWDEMKEHFDVDFAMKIKEVKKTAGLDNQGLSSEEKEFEKRLDILEARKKEKKESSTDMWEDE